MVHIDMWYGDKPTEADKIDIEFYDLYNEYGGNIYKNGEIIGDYSYKSSMELEKAFPHLQFNWE